MSSMPLQTDPMMEIFLDECSDLISQYETYLTMASDRKEYSLDIINEIFRITHTIKADATMMLFECVAVPVRSFERILFFYRDKKAEVNFDEFTELLSKLVEFLMNEIEMIVEGEAKEDDGIELEQEFNSYRDKIAEQLTIENVENIEKTVKKESYNEPMRFYIGSATESAENEEEPKAPRILQEFQAIKEAAAEAEKKKDEEKQQKAISDYEAVIAFEEKTKTTEYKWMKEKNHVTVAELQRLYDTTQGLYSLEGKIMERFGQDYGNFADLLTEFHEITISLLDWITSAATVPMGQISPKLRKTIDEMNKRLGHNVSITIKGEDIVVDKTWMDKLSGALVHMLRNSVDHGIESKELRLALGKPAEGQITVLYQHLHNDFIMKVIDDGRGIDTEKLKETAVSRGLIFDDDSIPKEDLLRLMFLPGITTNEDEGIYSGRGVGMDVVLHNIEEIGGRIEVESELEIGTTFTIIIPLNAISGGEEQEEDEDFDCRR